MKPILMLALAALLGTAANAQNIRGRELRQQGRIAQGVRSGELTRTETRVLERREAALHRSIVRDRVDGGGLTAVERARINGRQNQMSNQIYRFKHNGRVR